MYKSIFILLVINLACTSCKKNTSTPTNPIDQLPPATQVGANTFGCLINGQAFVPGNVAFGDAPVESNYQFLNNGYFFRLVGTYGYGNNISSVGIFTDSLSLVQGDSLMFSSFGSLQSGIATATYGGGPNIIYYNTFLPRYTGSLFITHFDSINQIISGTFWFNAVDQNGDTVHVSNGRFDVQYTR